MDTPIGPKPPQLGTAIAITTGCAACIALSGHVFLTLLLLRVLIVVMLAIAIVTDTRSRRIPNWVTYSSFLAAIVVNAIAGRGGDTMTLFGHTLMLPGVIGLGPSLLGAAGCFAAMFVLYDIAGSGGGDLKLATALGALLGLESGLLIILWTHLLAGAVLLVWSAWTHGVWRLATLLARSFARLFAPALVAAPQPEDLRLLQKPIPLAGFFAIGVFFTLTGVTLP